MIEWYDFYIFGSIATTISPLFYPPGNDTLAVPSFANTGLLGFKRHHSPLDTTHY
jgi:hypothetical protein